MICHQSDRRLWRILVFVSGLRRTDARKADREVTKPWLPADPVIGRTCPIQHEPRKRRIARSTWLVLVIGGFVIGFGAFVFAGFNMMRVFSPSRNSGFSAFFRGHIGAMIVMALGGLLFFVGLILGIVELLNRLV